VRSRRGGQPGNTNALKHGFYARSFHPVELSDLETLADRPDLSGAINMLQVLIRRVLEEGTKRANTLEDFEHLLDCLGTASVKMASLMRTSKMIGQEREDVAAALSAALRQVTEDLHLS
jgi:hypothetical protein